MLTTVDVTVVLDKLARLLGNSRSGFTVPTVLSVLTSVDSGHPVHCKPLLQRYSFSDKYRAPIHLRFIIPARARLYADATACLHYALIGDAQSLVTSAAG
jgi:hypothetical protein